MGGRKEFSECELFEIFSKYDPNFNIVRNEHATAFSNLSVQNYAWNLLEKNGVVKNENDD